MMSRIAVLDNESASLWYYPETKIVHHQIKKYIFGHRFRDLLNLGYEQFVKNGANKWLSDDRQNNMLTPADEKWGKTDWYPRVIKAGWKYWAIVLPARTLGQMNMQQFIEEYSKDGVITQVFGDPGEALAWLEKQQ